MSTDNHSHTARILNEHRASITERWTDQQAAAVRGRVSRPELAGMTQQFLALLTDAVAASGDSDTSGPAWQEVRDLLEDLSRERARMGFSPSETSNFILSLKAPLFEALQNDLANDTPALVAELLANSQMLDRLSMFTSEVAQRSREEVITRQQQELLELSTPVVRLWKGILALPLIGTLDSARTQVVMENLLQSIVETGSGIAIIDITGVPTVDTLVAQHLLKTVAAARLMGADCIISGIRPQTAQTIVHLGVDLSAVITKATLADAFAIALQRSGLTISRKPAANGANQAG